MRETSIREALLAQHFEDVDQLADKIADAAGKIERSTAALNALRNTRPAPTSKNPAVWTMSWRSGGIYAAAVLCGVIVSAMVGALSARSLPPQKPEQSQASDINRALVQTWLNLDTPTQVRIWNALDPLAKEALARSLRRQ